MKDRRQAPRGLLRWSLAGLFAASLWLGAYFGGRHTGFDGGHAEGFAAVQKDGLAAGRVEGIRQTVERYHRQGVYERAYDVSDQVSERMRAPDLSRPMEKEEFDAALDELIREIATNVAPGEWDILGGTGAKSIRGFPTNLTLVVSAEAVDHAEITLLLESRDDYFAWKLAEKAGRPDAVR